MGYKILVVDDEKDICDILKFNLEQDGYLVDVASSSEEALKILSHQHSLIILDVMMDGISGFTMAEKLRKRGIATPIMFLTAKYTEPDMLTGFSIGGDDYVYKPFSVKELKARTKAILNRTAADSSNLSPWVYENLTIDINTQRVTIDGEEIPLTKKEFNILSLLASVAPETRTRNEILNNVWGANEYVLDRTVDVHITRLRKKLKQYGSIIVNRSGFGYYLKVN